MLQDKMKSEGTVALVLKKADGAIKEERVYNSIVNNGKVFLTSRLFAAASDVFTYHIGIGGSNTAVALTQNNLLTAFGDRLESETPVAVTTSIANDTIQFVAEFGISETTLAIQEAGLFTSLTGNTMIARTVFGMITKAPDDTLTITWKIQQT
jgi:hypothetical protein